MVGGGSLSGCSSRDGRSEQQPRPRASARAVRASGHSLPERGPAGARDRSSAPKRVANRTAEDRVEVIVALRRLRFSAAEIAEALGMAVSTVSGILARLGLGRLGRLALQQPVRYE